MSVERVAVRTWSGGWAPWARDRWERLVNALHQVGVPYPDAMRAAQAVLALWIRESGYRVAEWNFNSGNITGSSPYGFHRLSHPTLTYRSYPDADTGVRDALRLLSTGRYRRAWDELLKGSTQEQWYAGILAAGYSADNREAHEEYASILRVMPRHLEERSRQ